MRSKMKKIREERGLSVEEMAVSLGISTSHYYKIESGIRNPNFILAGNIAKFFDSNVDKIFFDNELDKTSKKVV